MKFSGLLEKTLKVFAGFGLKVVFYVAIALKNKTQKQIDDKSADRGDPNSTIQSLCHYDVGRQDSSVDHSRHEWYLFG